MNLYDAINKAIDLFENWTNEKPAIIYLAILKSFFLILTGYARYFSYLYILNTPIIIPRPRIFIIIIWVCVSASKF